MEAFVTRKKRKICPEPEPEPELDPEPQNEEESEESTDLKLAMLASLHPDLDQETLLDILLAHDGAVHAASASLSAAQDIPSPTTKKSGPRVVGSQTSLKLFTNPSSGPCSSPVPKKSKLLSKKGATLHLYDPDDIAEHTPCSIIHNFLPSGEANALLLELLEESKTFEKITFKLFENVVTSPHTSSFYVGSSMEMDRQRHEYVYNGARLTDVRKITPWLDKVKPLVQAAVNAEIQKRILSSYPGAKKLKYQSPKTWVPNAAFVNCYNGPHESVGWHSDQLTYLGPRAVIGSLSLGVTREFRVRRVVPKKDDPDPDPEAAGDAGDAEGGQIAIHLPHNSLLVMHAEMQEEWKHSVSPAQAIDPHPLAGNRRINITYRDYREEFHPRYTPRCKCDIPTVLRVVQKKKKNENWGRYFWMCHAGNVPDKKGCSFFQWAKFDDDGVPLNTGNRK
ncbi:GRF zinc finger domain-containing protein [Diplogelasinospora grovesii]|uniref:GRF zinc finger domain-containing protein n=1 Tax=Diplogelasinospora grovesii TaxID=303347 RepID=A0AAN6NGV6_9PEZI|nr:GRF zinc finger domain-containing protein [Diplogelasinospora grovesii]